ncbi:rho family-interacting cell polarization regulator 1-like isoform X1 [Periophthalmus magnuspinnatus]|uniref:rho family-interacting cell polarization regulator 1-like isoform X1 n=1 Tax=Periophthalmus magnuspinnatus TaxID=409849 RepID=UPI00145B868A|nr:rho family-interacting cell polarization regulator 1-like isoform X1 [Periophthalmus magnuspinnatus]XP_033841385.1 rho family-interacting cell polarization regulator 1-like isoform X1 [Periophthalmus magnuspinnatus]
MFTGSTKLPPTKTPQPERLDEVYAALRRGLQSYLQVHQLELDSLGQQSRENKRNGRLGSLYELDKQVKAIERFMRRLEFHLSKVEELYDAYCIQRRLRDGASKMVAAFNLASGSREARESLSEANKGYKECTEHMCSLESELESHMGEFHVKMKGLAGFARLCAGDQYEVLMRYGRQRWRLRGRVEVGNKQIWDSEEYIFMPLITELLSIKVTELKSLANHVVVGTVSCEMLDLFCPLPQTLAVDINDLGTVKLNLEVTWSPFDKDDPTSSSSTVSKRLLSNQSPPDTPSMREQVFYSLLKRQGEVENGTVWSNSSESSDDSSSPALAHPTQRLIASNLLQTTLTNQLSLSPHKSSASTPSLSSNHEEEESETPEVFCLNDTVPNGHLQTPLSDCKVSDRASLQSADLSETSVDLCCSCPDVSESPTPLVDSLSEVSCDQQKDSVLESTETDVVTGEFTEGPLENYEEETKENEQPAPSEDMHHAEKDEESPGAPFPTSASFNQEVETALESFDFLNCSDLEEEENEKDDDIHEEVKQKEEVVQEVDQIQSVEDHNESIDETAKDKEKEDIFSEGSDEEVDGDLNIIMEAPEGFRNSDEDRYSESQESSVADLQDLGQIEMPEEPQTSDQEKGEEQHEEATSHDQEEPSAPSQLATTVF